MTEEEGEEIMIPYVPNSLITSIKEDYPYIKELLEYERDATLVFLKAQSACAFYKGCLDLRVEKEVKNWSDFIEFSRKYTRKIVQDGLQKYQGKEQDVDDRKKKFGILSMELLSPAIESISNAINDAYLKRFPCWPTNGSQNDYIEPLVKGYIEQNDIRFYWVCNGSILVKDTKFDTPINGCPYKAEFSGRPEFQLAYFDLDKIKTLNQLAEDSMPLLKERIDGINKKIIAQTFKNLLTNEIDL